MKKIFIGLAFLGVFFIVPKTHATVVHDFPISRYSSSSFGGSSNMGTDPNFCYFPGNIDINGICNNGTSTGRFYTATSTFTPGFITVGIKDCRSLIFNTTYRIVGFDDGVIYASTTIPVSGYSGFCDGGAAPENSWYVTSTLNNAYVSQVPIGTKYVEVLQSDEDNGGNNPTMGTTNRFAQTELSDKPNGEILPPTLEFIYPDSVSLSYTGRLDFTNWLVSAQLHEEGYLGVIYDDVTSTLANMRFRDRVFQYQLFPGVFSLFNDLFSIPKSNDLRAPILSLDAINGKTWYAYAFFQNTSGTNYYTPLRTFKIKRLNTPCFLFCIPTAPSSSALAGPFANDNSYVSPSSTLSYQDEDGNTVTTTSRYACSGLSDISGCLANAGNDIIDGFVSIPGRFSSGFTEAFKVIASTTKSTFPLSVVISFNNDINAAQATSTDIKIALGGNGTFGGRTYTFYSSSTTAWIQDQTGFDYKSFFDKLLYFAISMLIIFTTISIIRSHMNNRQPPQ